MKNMVKVIEIIAYTHLIVFLVCPAGWTKGALTMKDDVHLSKTYFEKVAKQGYITTNLLKSKGEQVDRQDQSKKVKVEY